MSSVTKQAANIANAQLSTGPRTEEGKTASSKNATKLGLFSTRDFIRPGEESAYAELCESLHRELAPFGVLESGLAEEIRRAMWRLRRCSETEAAMIEPCLAAANGPDSPIPDPLQIEATARLQLAVDRARAQAHRLLHKCTAELRKLQTERHFRLAVYEPTLDTSGLGLIDAPALIKSLRQPLAAKHQHDLYAEMFAANQTQQPRNSQCACGSGLKYKRCCAGNVVKAAA